MGVVMHLAPYYLSCSDNSDVDYPAVDKAGPADTIVISRTCEVIGFLTAFLVDSCLKYPDPVPRTIALSSFAGVVQIGGLMRSYEWSVKTCRTSV